MECGIFLGKGYNYYMKTNLNINIATDEYGKDLEIDLASINHLLISGNAGSGKSVILHNIISTLILNNSPEKLKFIMSDPKQIELGIYNKIPHLLTPVLTEQKKSILAMKWAGKEMNRRLVILKEKNIRNIEEYHKDIVEPDIIEKIKKPRAKPDSDAYYQSDTVSGSTVEYMPYIVITIDEFSNVMQEYPKEAEPSIVKILEMGHIVGIHLILSTSRPNTKIFTKSMRDLIGTRIVLQTTSAQDSKSVIGTADACGLKGEGHMLYREGMKYIIRGQSSFISIEEIKKVVKIQVDAYREEVVSEVNLSTVESNKDAFFSTSFDSDDDSEYDDLYEQAKEIVIVSGKASTSWLQRKMGIGYSRAAKLIDLLEKGGLVGPANGSKMREVFTENDKA
jgi:S-DNA-T family DNA segregation ATPase FtsK/SpoIIIE